MRFSTPAPPCVALIADLHAIERASVDEAALVARVAERLASSGAERHWLVRQARKLEPKRYSQELIYVAPDRRFSVVALSWAPGARTSIHDHAGWCAVAVYEGSEHETRYRLCRDARGPYLVETGARSLELGQTVGMVADGHDIHRVGNRTREVTISLHVYGIDIERTGSSVKNCFDALPIHV